MRWLATACRAKRDWLLLLLLVGKRRRLCLRWLLSRCGGRQHDGHIKAATATPAVDAAMRELQCWRC